MNLEEKQISSKTIYDGKILNLKVDEVLLPNGEKSVREYVCHSGGACVVAVMNDGKILMEKQFRYANGKEFWEIPAGKFEVGEMGNPMETAIRELEEETGARAKSMELLAIMQPTICYSTETIYIYLAKGLEFGNEHRDKDEFMEIQCFELSELIDMINRNEITDGKTAYGLLRYAVKEKLI